MIKNICLKCPNQSLKIFFKMLRIYIFLLSVDEVLPGRTILDKNPLPPIKTKNNHDDPPKAVTTPDLPSELDATTVRSPKRLPKLEGRPPTNLPFDPIVTSQVPLSVQESSSVNEENDSSRVDLNSPTGSNQSESKSLDSAAKKYLAPNENEVEVEDDDQASAQNEENEGKIKKYLHSI